METQRTFKRNLFMVAAMGLAVLAAGVWQPSRAAEPSTGAKRVGYQGLSQVPGTQQPSVFVEPVMLTQVYHRMGPGLQLGAVVADGELGAGLQKAADVWGLNLDLFVVADAARRFEMARHLIDNFESMVVVEGLAPSEVATLTAQAEKNAVLLRSLPSQSGSANAFETGFATLRGGRAELLARIPKYDEVLPVAFPISPMPDSFFQPSKFPYPRPLVRVERTSEPKSASVHAHTSCNMVAQTGNMLHRTSSLDPDLFLMGMEGGNLSLKALPGAVDSEKISAVMTSWVMAVRGPGSTGRDILVENDGVGTSFFKPALHAPEEFDLALEGWKREGKIRGYRRVSEEEVVLEGWDGADRRLRAGMFLIAYDGELSEPRLTPGRDARGRRTLEFISTQRFLQMLGEIDPAAATPGAAEGGILTTGGGQVGALVGTPLGELLQKVDQKAPSFQPFVLSLEGGFLVVTPEVTLSESQLRTPIERIDLDLRGPLTSDQTVLVTLEGGEKVVFRRTILNFDELDQALARLEAQGMVESWKYDGARGRGLNANVVLQQFLGKHRKFMSSLCTWPNENKTGEPVVRFYVDGMQRLNFSFIDSRGWRQEFVEVPLQVPPVPRDVELYSGIYQLD